MSDAQRDSGEMNVAPEAVRPRESAAEPGRGRISVRCAGRTAVGQVRDHNEDNFVVANLDTGSVRARDQMVEDAVGDRGLIFAVCDGMGGAAAGEVASQMAVDILVEAMRRGGVPKNRDALARRLVSAVEEAGRRIFDAAQRERSRRGMGTTATVAVLVDKVLFVAEVGDSRAYLLRRGQLKQLTKDQSLVNQLIEAGHLTEDEAEAFEHSNIILQALGTSETVQVDLTFVELRRGDRLMMCSDGLSGLVHGDMLRTALEQIKDPAESAAKLIEYAETAGGHDNITVVIADFDGEGLVEPGDADMFGYVQYPLPLTDDESGAFGDEETTSAGSELRRSSLPDTQGPPRDSDASSEHPPESLLPLSGDSGDARANALWIMGGVLALVAAVVVWFSLEPRASEDDHAGVPVARPEPSPEEAAQDSQEVAAAQEVEVNVHTDVERATLLVNGETQGALSATQSRSLKLRPGAYRFEAHSDGNQVAVTVATVRGDMPMDVFLQLPKGATERAAAEEAAEPTVEDEQHAEAPGRSAPNAQVPSREPAPGAGARQAEPAAGESAREQPARRQPADGAEPKVVVKPVSVSSQPEPDAPAARVPPAASPVERPAPARARTPSEPSPESAPQQPSAGREAATGPAPKPDVIPENPF